MQRRTARTQAMKGLPTGDPTTTATAGAMPSRLLPPMLSAPLLPPRSVPVVIAADWALPIQAGRALAIRAAKAAGTAAGQVHRPAVRESRVSSWRDGWTEAAGPTDKGPVSTAQHRAVSKDRQRTHEHAGNSSRPADGGTHTDSHGAQREAELRRAPGWAGGGSCEAACGAARRWSRSRPRRATPDTGRHADPENRLAGGTPPSYIHPLWLWLRQSQLAQTVAYLRPP